MISVILTSPDPSSQPSFADLTRFTAVHLHGPLRIDGPPRCGGHSALEIQVGAYHDSSRPLAVLNFHDSDLQPNLKPRRRPKLRQTGPDPRAGPTQWATADAVLRLLTAGRWAHLGVAATTHADAGSYFGLAKRRPETLRLNRCRMHRSRCPVRSVQRAVGVTWNHGALIMCEQELAAYLRAKSKAADTASECAALERIASKWICLRDLIQLWQRSARCFCRSRTDPLHPQRAQQRHETAKTISFFEARPAPLLNARIPISPSRAETPTRDSELRREWMPLGAVRRFPAPRKPQPSVPSALPLQVQGPAGIRVP